MAKMGGWLCIQNSDIGRRGGDAVMLGGRAAGSYQGRPNVFEQEEEGKERKEN